MRSGARWGITHFLLILLIASSGCKEEGERPLDDSLFVEVLADLLIAEVYVRIEEAPPGLARDSVFQVHGITAEQYELTLEERSQDPSEYLQLYERAINLLNERRLGMNVEDPGDEPPPHTGS